MIGKVFATTRAPRLRLGRNLENAHMNNLLLKLYIKFQDLLEREEGQDMAEYALVVALIALGAIVSVKYVTTALGTLFTTISNSL